MSQAKFLSETPPSSLFIWRRALKTKWLRRSRNTKDRAPITLTISRPQSVRKSEHKPRLQAGASKQALELNHRHLSLTKQRVPRRPFDAEIQRFAQRSSDLFPCLFFKLRFLHAFCCSLLHLPITLLPQDAWPWWIKPLQPPDHSTS